VIPFTWLATGVDRRGETVIVKLLPSAHPCKREEGSRGLTDTGRVGKWVEEGIIHLTHHVV